MKKDCCDTIILNPNEINIRIIDLKTSDLGMLPDDQRKSVLLEICYSVWIGGKTRKIGVKPIKIEGPVNASNIRKLVKETLGEDWLPIDSTTYFQLLARGIMRGDCTFEQLAVNAASLGGYEDSDENAKPVGDIEGLIGGYHTTVVVGKNDATAFYGGNNKCYGDIKSCPLDHLRRLYLPPGKETYRENMWLMEFVTYGMKIL